VTVIATGFDKRRGGAVFDAERSQQRRERPRDRGDIAMDDRQRSSLEISEDEIDIPSFLKD
jgi:cell division protein FtsZ